MLSKQLSRVVPSTHSSWIFEHEGVLTVQGRQASPRQSHSALTRPPTYRLVGADADGSRLHLTQDQWVYFHMLLPEGRIDDPLSIKNSWPEIEFYTDSSAALVDPLSNGRHCRGKTSRRLE